ncbi:DUF4296 domain-containing protein [Flavisolibacter nicotianae]|uniref:DUF4296 domain-containing protein n=1 Tax=Flavisolibacter nicotianae TaxID=2364882 RepID=UPI000EAF5CF9|nr:DUF4296 domain-containing protein [Flavisolibacter nicotianae]
MRYLFLLAIVFAATACTSSVPEEIMPKEKMGAVLYDVIRADEMTDFLLANDSTYREFSKRASFYDTIFQLHAVKKEDFQKSLRFYQGRPDLLKEILDSLQKKVSPAQSQRSAPLQR